MFQHKAPHRNWAAKPQTICMMYDDVETIPEPPTLFDDYATRDEARPAKQHMSIDHR